MHVTHFVLPVFPSIRGFSNHFISLELGFEPMAAC